MKKILKNINLKSLINFLWPIVLALVLLIPVPYYITIGGGVMKLDKDIKITNEYKNEGSINATYVSEVKGTIITYLLSYIIPSFEKEEISDVVMKDEEIKDYEFREKMSFNSSIDNAIYVAYTSAKKDIKVEKSNLYIIAIDEFSNTNLKVQDQIIKVENKQINSTEELQEEINKYNENDYINIKVLRGKKEINTKSLLRIIDNEKKLGIYVINDYKYTLNPKIKFDFSGKQNGPSGGLMLTLAIYNKLVEEDITKGNKICGTGTIDNNGTIGEIGGIEYKIKGAIRKKCDIFLTPQENYEKAKNIVNENKTKMKLYKVSTFNEALTILKNKLYKD